MAGYLIEYSKTGKVRVSDNDYETEWMPISDSGDMAMEIGEGASIKALYITLSNYEGSLEPNKVYPILNAASTEVDEDVEEDEGDDEEEEDDSEGDCDAHEHDESGI